MTTTRKRSITVILGDGRAQVGWQDRAACRDEDTYWFFVAEGKNNGYEAKKVCRKCPVIEVCLTFAIEHKLELGVFGGMNHRERRLEGYRRKREGEAPYANGNGTKGGQ